MELKVLKGVIEDQKRELERKFKEEKIIEREYTKQEERYLKYPNIFVILGVRRSGKSTFSLILSKKLGRYAYINFDDERLLNVKTEDLNKILQAFYELYNDVDLIILDEIQDVRGWELFVNRLRRTKKVIITGSNSKLLFGELATHLTGRYIDFVLYPFSFREILSFKPDIYITEDRAKVRKELEKYINGSGFPEFLRFGSSMVVRIYEDIIHKDCLRRYKIEKEKTFRELASYLVSNFSSEFTYSKLGKIFNIKDVHTVKNYVGYLKEAFLIVVLERYSRKLKQQIIAPKKVYAVDHGFCNFISFRLSKDLGKIFENIVLIDLLRRKTGKNGEEVYYWKNYTGSEVDFVVKEGFKVKQLIQVCYDINNTNTREREVKALIKASRELRCNNLLVITDDYEGQEKIDEKKINYTPLWRWLLE